MEITSKNNRKNISNQLSQAVSIEEIVIETVAEMTRQKLDVVSEFFQGSETSKKIFDFATEYYLNDINIIVAEFARECIDKKGWKID